MLPMASAVCQLCRGISDMQLFHDVCLLLYDISKVFSDYLFLSDDRRILVIL